MPVPDCTDNCCIPLHNPVSAGKEEKRTGGGFKVNTILSLVVPAPSVTSTQYSPELVTIIEAEVAPVFHKKVAPTLLVCKV